jgi:hypothetical protein
LILFIEGNQPEKNTTNQMKHTITSNNINAEPYYNLVQLQRLTRYADPISAVKSLKVEWTVIKDECGNIVRLA